MLLKGTGRGDGVFILGRNGKATGTTAETAFEFIQFIRNQSKLASSLRKLQGVVEASNLRKDRYSMYV